MIAKADSHYILNQTSKKTNGQIPDFGITDTVIYEVVRVIDKKILFLEAHLERFFSSLRNLGFTQRTHSEIITSLQKVIDLNQIENGNIQFLLALHQTTGTSTFMAFVIPHSYPTDLQYLHGVPASIADAMRPSPGIKIQHADLRQRINQIIQKENVYEVIMLHPDGYITEGSRSNIFMIKNNEVYSTQIGEILPGITLQYIFGICKKINISIIERKISAEELLSMDALFLTGTSPKVLPIANIGSTKFDVKNSLLRLIMKEFDKIIKNYLESNQIFPSH